MNKLNLKALLAAGLLAATPFSMADDVSGFTLIFPSVGIYDFDNDRGLDAETFSKSGGLGYQIDKHWALEGIYTGIETESDSPLRSGVPAGQKVDFDQIRFDTLYTINPEDSVQGYAVFGAGQGEFEEKLFDATKKTTLVNYGVGLKFPVTDRFAVRGDVRAFRDITENETDAAVTLSLNWLFLETGRIRDDSDGDGIGDKMDACADTPAGVQVDEKGCAVDSDGDGVADHMDKCADTPAGVAVDEDGCALDDDGDGVPNDQDNCPDSTPGSKVDDTGCYIMLEEQVEIRLDVEFDLNSAATREDHRPEVQRLADFMTQHPQSDVQIEGHSDSSGAATYNQQLSEKRAATIAKMLVDDFGIDSARVQSVGYGEERPTADNSTAAGRQENRRVVAVVTATKEVRATE